MNTTSLTFTQMNDSTYKQDGDVRMHCQGNRFVVSSETLSLASPMFAFMLDPFLSELRFDTDGKFVVDLDEYDPLAVRIFCNVIHNYERQVDEVPAPDTLFHLSLFIDKYKCHQIFLYHAVSWLRGSLNRRSDNDLWYMLHFAYVMDLEDRFSKIASQLVCVHKPTNTYTGWPFPNGPGIMPKSVPGLLFALSSYIHLNRPRTNAPCGTLPDSLQTMQNRLHIDVRKTIIGALRECETATRKRKRDEISQVGETMKSQLKETLQQPASLGFQQKSYNDICDAAKDLPIDVIRVTQLDTKLRSCRNGIKGLSLYGLKDNPTLLS